MVSKSTDAATLNFITYEARELEYVNDTIFCVCTFRLDRCGTWDGVQQRNFPERISWPKRSHFALDSVSCLW